jgi:hypothetical protein
MVICAGLCIGALAVVAVAGIGAAGAIGVASQTKKANKYTNVVDVSNSIQHTISKIITENTEAHTDSHASADLWGSIKVGGDVNIHVGAGCPQNLSAGTIEQKALVESMSTSFADSQSTKNLGDEIKDTLSRDGDIDSKVGSGGIMGLLSNEERSTTVEAYNDEKVSSTTNIRSIITTEAHAVSSANASASIDIIGNFNLTCDEATDEQKKKLENQSDQNLQLQVWLLNHWKNPDSWQGKGLRFASAPVDHSLHKIGTWTGTDMGVAPPRPRTPNDPPDGLPPHQRIQRGHYEVYPPQDWVPATSSASGTWQPRPPTSSIQVDPMKDSSHGEWTEKEMTVEDFKNKFKNHGFETSTKLFSLYQNILVKSVASSSAKRIGNTTLKYEGDSNMTNKGAVTASNGSSDTLYWVIIGVLVVGGLVVLHFVVKKLRSGKAAAPPAAPPQVGAIAEATQMKKTGGKSQSIFNMMKQSIIKKTSIYKIICAIIILFLFFKNNFRKL